MKLSIHLDHGEDDVKQAIVQFAARRSYRLREAWYLHGLRIQVPPDRSSDSCNGRVDIELKRKRGKTRLSITVGRGSQSTKLAHDLQSYLQDERAYHAQCPSMCHKCGRPVPNLHARYCGRCGTMLVTGDVEKPTPVASPVKAAPPLVPLPAVSVPQARPLRSPVVVERDAAPEPAAATVETEVAEQVARQPAIKPTEVTSVQPAQPEREAPAPAEIESEAEKDVIKPPAEMPIEAVAEAEAEVEMESDHRDENRPRRALAEE